MAEAFMTIKNVYQIRTCTVDGAKALFHRWADMAQVVGASPLAGGSPGGQLYHVYGLVEFEDGTVQMVDPERIQFEDTDFGQYAWKYTTDS